MIKFLHRKENVILTAIEIIDELGIQGLSTREIAKRQEISEGTLFRHFKSKREIVIAVLDYFSQYDADIFHSVKLKKMKSTDAIVFLIDSHVTYYENYPAITALTQLYGVLAADPDYAEKMTKILLDRRNFLKEVIEGGQKAGELSSTIESDLLVSIIEGTFRDICLTWRMNGRKFPLRDNMLAALNVLLVAFSRSRNDVAEG